MENMPIAKVTVTLEYADGYRFTATAAKATRIELTLDRPPLGVGPFDPWALPAIPVPSARHLRLEFDVEPSGGPVAWLEEPSEAGARLTPR